MIIERKRFNDLEGALRKADEQITHFRLSTKNTAVDLLNQHRFTLRPAKARTDGIDPSKLAEISRKKLISSFEHRLNHMHIRLSQSENYNEKLKLQINSVRRHRVSSGKSRVKIEQSIREVNYRVEKVLERSYAISETRDTVVKQLRELHRSQAEDRATFSKQMKSLSEFIDQQNREFEESMATAATSSVTHNNALGEGSLTRGLMTIEEETKKAGLVEELAKQIVNEKDVMQHTKDKIFLYRTSFTELKRVSGINALGEIVRKYVKSEEETFSLFNYVQAQNQETDWTLKRRARLEAEICTYEDKLSEEETQRADAMADLQGKWRSAKENADECKYAVLEAQRALEQIARRIQSFFFKIQCDQLVAIAHDASGNKDGQRVNRSGRSLALLPGRGVTKSNILAYAELIEQRAFEIMSDYNRRINNREKCATGHTLDPSRSLTTAISQDYIHPPGIEEDENDLAKDADARPVGLEEIRRRTAERISQNKRYTKDKMALVCV